MLLPSVLTLWIVVQAYRFIDNNIAEPINRGIRVALVNTNQYWYQLIPNVDSPIEAERIHAWWREHWGMNLIGLVVAIIGVYIAGRLVGGFLGRQIYRRLERLITSLPVFKWVYPHVKQVVDFLFGEEKPIEFNRVVVCEYPRKGIWSVGFATGDPLRSVYERAGDSVTIFIPSSPTPFTGYTITVPRKEVFELPISVEEAIRFAVTGGVLIPEHQKIGAGANATAQGQAAAHLPGGPSGSSHADSPGESKPTSEAGEKTSGASDRDEENDDNESRGASTSSATSSGPSGRSHDTSGN